MWLYILCSYDLLRYFLKKSFQIKAYVYEHIVKVVGALAAICSAFLGTILPEYQPFSPVSYTHLIVERYQEKTAREDAIPEVIEGRDEFRQRFGLEGVHSLADLLERLR